MLHRLKRELFRRQEFYTACAREMQSRLSRATSRNCKNSARNSSFDDANFARARRQTRRFSSQNAPPTQPRAVPASQNFCNDAGWINCVLRIANAENLQKVRELLRGKFARSRRSRRCTRIFCVAKRCADSSENAAPPPAMSWQTSRVLCSARSRTSRKFCTNFANFELFLRGKFARSRC